MIPKLNPNDVHFVFNGPTGKLKCFDSKGKPLWTVEARNDTTKADDKTMFFGHEGHCPPGDFILGSPIAVIHERDTYGSYVIPIEDIIHGDGPMHEYRRQLLRIHAGHWRMTEGCIRVKEKDLQKIVDTVNRPGRAYLNVDWGLNKKKAKKKGGEA